MERIGLDRVRDAGCGTRIGRIEEERSNEGERYRL